jgi:hypothetical protein
MAGSSLIFEIVQGEGFKVNEQKTSLMRRNTCQRVTGLVVNSRVNIAKYRKKVWRAIFHQAKLDPKMFRRREAELRGYVEFLKMVCPQDGALDKYTEILENLRS